MLLLGLILFVCGLFCFRCAGRVVSLAQQAQQAHAQTHIRQDGTGGPSQHRVLTRSTRRSGPAWRKSLKRDSSRRSTVKAIEYQNICSEDPAEGEPEGGWYFGPDVGKAEPEELEAEEVADGWRCF